MVLMIKATAKRTLASDYSSINNKYQSDFLCDDIKLYLAQEFGLPRLWNSTNISIFIIKDRMKMAAAI
jgi:hypothetical protein